MVGDSKEHCQSSEELEKRDMYTYSILLLVFLLVSLSVLYCNRVEMSLEVIVNNEAAVDDATAPSPTSGGPTASIQAPYTGSGSAVSSPASVHSPHRPFTTEQTPPVQDDEVSSPSSTRKSWLTECALELKDTDAANAWKFIGRQLGLDEAMITSIESKWATDIKEAFYQMMLGWKQTMGEQATCDKLIEALEKQKLKAVAEKVEKYRHFSV